MTSSALWFAGMLAASAAAFFVGRWASRRRGAQARVAAGVALALLLAWGWLQHNPVTLVHLLPLSVLGYLEGTGGAPLFALILGIAWSWSHLPRERKAVLLGLGVGAVYFVRGGLWMVQTTPTAVFADASPNSSMVMQSQDFSCGPAACATTLHLLGVRATEAEMAQLTQTRAGSGTTMIRALEGLTQRLAGTSWNVELAAPTWDEMRNLPMPALALMRFHFSEAHMVTVLRVRPNIIQVADPVDGRMYFWRSDFEKQYEGQMLVFTPRGPLAKR